MSVIVLYQSPGGGNFRDYVNRSWEKKCYICRLFTDLFSYLILLHYEKVFDFERVGGYGGRCDVCLM